MKRRLAFLLLLALALGPWGCSPGTPGLSSSQKEGEQDSAPLAKSLPSETEEGFSAGKNEPALPMQPPPKIDPQDLKELVRGNNEFALDLYARLAQTTEGNMVFSPFSISTALAMTYAGARGQTAEEMAKVLRFTLPPERLHKAFANLLWELGGDGKPRAFKLHTANALWGQQGYPFLDSFLRLGKDHYQANLQELDFIRQTEQARQTINRWVADQTIDKIKELLGPKDLDPQTLLVLTNALFFKGAWATPFLKGETKDAWFEVSPTEKITVPMMYTQKAPFRYYASEECQWLELPYQSGKVSMILLLPQKRRFTNFEKGLTASAIQEGIEKLRFHRGKVDLPRFKVNAAARLKNELSRMGMPTPFSGDADFSGMAKGNLMINNVIHQGYLKADELGSEAAAATAVEIMKEDFPPFSFTANRPFMVLIQENHTGSILFLGRIVHPSKLV